MDVPSLGAELELHLLVYAIATAMSDIRHVCDPQNSSVQHQILKPLRKSRNWTYILMDTSHIHFRWAMTRTSIFLILIISYMNYPSIPLNWLDFFFHVQTSPCSCMRWLIFICCRDGGIWKFVYAWLIGSNQQEIIGHAWSRCVWCVELWSCNGHCPGLKMKSRGMICPASPAPKLVPDVLWITREILCL